jgi:hypothetical protein
MAPDGRKRGFFPLDAVMDAARGRWPAVLADLGVAAGLLRPRHGPCPGCGGRDRFRFDDRDGEGTFICSQGGGGNLSGNGLTLLEHVHGWDFKRVLEEVGKLLLTDADRVVWRSGGGYAGGSGSFTPREQLPEAQRPADLPEAEDRAEIPKYNEELLRGYVDSVGKVSRDDLRAASPCALHGIQISDFFEALYLPGERVLVFDEYYSQGDYLFEVGRGSFRLSRDRGVKAVRSPLPQSGKGGVWFLSNPVTGAWEPKEQRTVVKHKVPEGQHGPAQAVHEVATWSRRHWPCVTTYRYAVMESDDAPEDLWLKALWKLPLPIVALYTSAGKSIHALLRIDAGSKLVWDKMVRGMNTGSRERTFSLMSLVCPLGADPAALTAVRLTRLPGCAREGRKVDGKYQRYDRPRMQELLYLNPVPPTKPVPWRSIEAGGAR